MDLFLKNKSKKSNSQSDLLLMPKLMPASNRSTRVFNQPFDFIFPNSKRSNSRLCSDNKISIFPKSNRSQITVFIILAICIVIVLFLLFTKKSDFVTIFAKESPSLEMEKCIKGVAKEGVDILSLQGGSLNPKNFYLYNGSSVSYVCYTNQYYVPCVMQKPMLKESIEEELSAYIKQKSTECLAKIKQVYESKGYGVSMNEAPDIRVELIPNNVKIIADVNLELSKDTTQVFKKIKVDTQSDSYDFVMITSSIANFEARYGDSETMNYMYFNPDLKVEKKTRSDGTRIYILTNRKSLDKFLFATRSFARPSGVTGN